MDPLYPRSGQDGAHFVSVDHDLTDASLFAGAHTEERPVNGLAS